MALVIKESLKLASWILDDLPDKRLDDWFLMKSIWPILWISVIYLYMILKLGPTLMKDRKPFNIEKLMILYNGLQILACLYITIEGTRVVLQYNVRCAPVDYSNSSNGLMAAKIAWTYFLIKVTDLLDTVFFILRKKERQISFLHVYHHWGMVLLSWTFAKYVGGGATLYIIIFNSFVHVVMYCYYFLTAFDAKYKQSIWWKKHITQLQLLQFFILVIQHINMLFTGCPYPIPLLILYICQSFLFFGLFGDFYFTTYIKPSFDERRRKSQLLKVQQEE